MNTYHNDINHIFYESLPWEKLSGTNILITGATGLIGSTLVDVLMSNPRRDYSVYASGRNIERGQKRFEKYLSLDTFRFIRYDVMTSLQSDVQFDYIIHAASNASPNTFFKNPVSFFSGSDTVISNLSLYLPN